jgi:ribonucleoside-diphosphate reductase beta chain
MTTTAPLRSPQELYDDWERSHWAAQDVDLAHDAEQWRALGETERGLLCWVLSALLAAEERISTQFVGLVYAQDDEEEGSFLSTQLVDEVRHMQFYVRFQNEVVADPAAIAQHVARAREVLAEPFRVIFDDALGSAHSRLIAEPRNREAKVDFVTIYHMAMEGTLGMTTSHFLLDSCPSTTSCRASWRATGSSPRTSSATSPTGPSSCAAPSPKSQQWATSCAPASTTCCPR